ncbi:unnamed protein product, partial [Mesorhabditis spiculigera]
MGEHGLFGTGGYGVIGRSAGNGPPQIGGLSAQCDPLFTDFFYASDRPLYSPPPLPFTERGMSSMNQYGGHSLDIGSIGNGQQFRFSQNYHHLNHSCDSTVMSSNSRSDVELAPTYPDTKLMPYDIFDANRNAYSLDVSAVYQMIERYAKDKLGCKYLQDNLPPAGPRRDAVFAVLMRQPDSFESLAFDVFANFYAQKLVESAKSADQVAWIRTSIVSKIPDICYNRYSCRVVQKSLEVLPESDKLALLSKIMEHDVVTMAVDQNANHIVQKIVEKFKPAEWKLMLNSVTSHDGSFFRIMESKYGCRVMQLTVDTLSKQLANKITFCEVQTVLVPLMEKIFTHCERLSSNEFANYVIQHTLQMPNLGDYRNRIIEQCLLRNLLSLSQEKFASHVVEKALAYAPPQLRFAMLEELFDGYLPDVETGKDCLDVLLFHQYGNYVVQRMLTACIDVLKGPRSAVSASDLASYRKWTGRLTDQISENVGHLSRYSSGKKIIQLLQDYVK